MAVTRLLSRPLLASIFLVGGFNAFRNASAMAPMAKPVTDKVVPRINSVAPVTVPQDPVFWVRVNAATQLVAGGALAIGRAPRLSSTVLAASLVPTTIAGHAFWNSTDPAERKQQTVKFFTNVSVLGGLLTAATDTEGKPGLAWRTRRVAKDARREARHLAHSAKREAKLVKAELT